MRSYQLTQQAEQDLKEIYHYTIKTWGKKLIDANWLMGDPVPTILLVRVGSHGVLRR